MIGKNIHSLRMRLGITQEELGEQIGVARQTVVKWETGEAIPDLSNASALADVLGVSLDALVNHDEERLGYPIGPRGKHIFGIVRMGERGQIVIPKKAREVFDLRTGSELLVLGDESSGLALQRVEDAEAMIEHYGRVISTKIRKGS